MQQPTKMKQRRCGAVVTAVVLGIAGLVVAPAPKASAATSIPVSGVVGCTNGQPAVGVWIQSSAGGSKWATSWQMPGFPTHRVFSATVSSPSSTTKISIHAGCGGSSSSWGKDLYAPSYSVGAGGRVLNFICDYTKPTRTVACSSAPRGPVVNYNQGYAGWCTYGAYLKWRESTGYYPNIGGNAIQMDDNAIAKGFRVSRTPHARAMVVFNTGTYGHVGWVTRVYKDSSGRIVFDFWDMNGGSDPDGDGKTTDFNRFVKRYGKVFSSTQRFILAPN